MYNEKTEEKAAKNEKSKIMWKENDSHTHTHTHARTINRFRFMFFETRKKNNRRIGTTTLRT